MTKLKFKSKKDGCSGLRWETYASYSPNTYSVLLDGIEVGELLQVPDVNYNYKTTKWIYVGEGGAIEAQYLLTLKDLLRRRWLLQT